MSIIFPGRTLCTVVLFAALVACGSDSADEYIARAEQFMAESNYDSATIELKNALQRDGKSGQARWLLGKIYLESGDILSAEKELQRALKLGWSHDDLMPALAAVLLAQSKYSEVGKLDSSGLKPQVSASLASSKAMAAMAQGETRRAKKLIERALKLYPASSDALLARARMLASQGDIPGADEVLAALLAREPENGTAWDLLGDVRMSQQQLDEAAAAYGHAIEFTRSNYGSLFKRALLYFRLENFEAAQTDTRKLLAVAPQHPRANYVQGLLNFQAGKYEETVSAMSLAEPAAEQFPLVLFFLASAQLIEGHLDLASVQAVRFNNRVPESIRGRMLLATIRLQEGDFGEVQTLLAPVLAANPDDVGALNIMANALLRDGKIDEGITALSRVAELQPDSPVAQVRLGAGLLISGNNDSAEQHMESALELAPEFQQADILLVLNHLQKKDYTAAIEAAQAYKRRHLTSVTPYNLLGRVYLEAGQQDEARASFEKALTFDKSDPAANHNLAQLAISGGDLARARQHYNTILAERENFLPAMIQLALLDARENNKEALLERLEQAIDAHPGELQPRLLMGRFQLSQGRPDKVAPIFADLDEVQRRSPPVLQLIALAQLSENENTEAQYTLEQLMDETPDSPALHLMMARAASGAGDAKRAERELHRALELDENYLPARIALARVALSGGQLEEFNGHLKKLTAQAPENIDVILLRAAAAANAGNFGAAVELAEQAYKLAPVRATLLALAAHQVAAGDNEAAHRLYRNWIAKNPEDVAVRLVFADNLYKIGKVDAAVVQYHEVIKLDPDNIPALNNAAWHIREKDPARALEYIRHATSLAPGLADVLDTQAVVEYNNKDYGAATRSIERALDKRPDNSTLIYHKAMILAAKGDSAAAVEALNDILGREVFPESDQAQALLDDLTN